AERVLHPLLRQPERDRVPEEPPEQRVVEKPRRRAAPTHDAAAENVDHRRSGPFHDGSEGELDLLAAFRDDPVRSERRDRGDEKEEQGEAEHRAEFYIRGDDADAGPPAAPQSERLRLANSQFASLSSHAAT